MTPEIIALAGKAGSGKDTVAEQLEDLASGQGQCFSFAQPLKDALTCMFGGRLSFDTMSRAEKESPIDFLAPLGPITPRQLAQTLGTEWGRSVHPGLWVHLLALDVEDEAKWMADRGMALIAIVTDCRFPNEVAWVKSQGGVVWWIERDGMPQARAHASENAIGPQDCDRVIKNLGTLADLDLEVACAWEQHWDERRAA